MAIMRCIRLIVDICPIVYTEFISEDFQIVAMQLNRQNCITGKQTVVFIVAEHAIPDKGSKPILFDKGTKCELNGLNLQGLATKESKTKRWVFPKPAADWFQQKLVAYNWPGSYTLHSVLV